ncbi:helix-turn-helix domain-containing protein [Enterococcus sp. AZ072]|uniref:helix-turn-helix domain-containing protein n=1 Tax=unclassified Enterococcus TaxID=2608891 RepID=UPI003D2DED33
MRKERMMLSNDFLMEEDRYKLYLLQYLELNKSFYCSIEQISDLLELSRYKVEKYLNELKDDLREQALPGEIEVIESGEIRISELSHMIVKKMRLFFIEKSRSFQIFHQYVTKEKSLDLQIEELHLSRSSTYRLYKKLKILLKEEGIQIRKNQLVGSEFVIRSFLLNVYYEIFNGLHNPFDEIIQNQTKELIHYLYHYLNLSLPKTQEHKLLFFISIWLIRIKNGHCIDEVFIEYQDNSLTRYLYKWLNNHTELTKENQQKEIAGLLLFLQTIEVVLDPPICFVERKEDQQARKLADDFLQHLANHSVFTFSYLIQNNKLNLGLLTINRRWLIYHFRETTFVTKVQRRYFQEINPKLDRIIQQFIEKVDRQELFHTELEKNKLYYDYLFFLMGEISVEELEDPVFVCIDFSHGSNYNQYIQKILSSLQSMNICYEQKLSAKTQIYLSDFLINKLPCHQMIWRRPPTPEDWSEFGQLLLDVKGEGNE